MRCISTIKRQIIILDVRNSISFQVIMFSIRVDVVYLRGLYFKKVYDKQNMHGLLLFSEGDRFKARRMYHKDEAVLDDFMHQLSRHCVFYSPADVYE
jgi:hypothetical protein